MLPLDLFFDAASTTVAASQTAVSQGTTQSWTVGSSSLFVDVNGNSAVTGETQFRVVDPADTQQPPEIILVTNVSGTTWSVTRGADNTTPTAHSSGFTVQAIATSGNLTPLGRVNQGLASGNPATSGTGETVLVSWSVPAGTIISGSTYRIVLSGVSSSTGALTFKLRIGPAGTTADALVCGTTATAAQAANEYAHVMGLLNVHTPGSTGGGSGSLWGAANAIAIAEAVTSLTTFAINTTVANFITLTCACSAGSFTTACAVLEQLV